MINYFREKKKLEAQQKKGVFENLFKYKNIKPLHLINYKKTNKYYLFLTKRKNVIN